MQPTYYSIVPSPVGPLTLALRGGALVALSFDGDSVRERRRAWSHDDQRLEEARAELDAYFHGERRSFDLPLRLEGTPFQLRVWQALREIPFGETTSYGEIARRIGRTNWPGARAVGAANGQNPIGIIVPCHRVIGADGSLTGYGGGLPRKRWLLAHEGALETSAGVAQTSLF